MAGYQFLWSPFALYNMKKVEEVSRMSATKKEGGLKGVIKLSKTLALSSEKKEVFDENEMKT